LRVRGWYKKSQSRGNGPDGRVVSAYRYMRYR
jgi:hypothetical protein